MSAADASGKDGWFDGDSPNSSSAEPGDDCRPQLDDVYGIVKQALSRWQCRCFSPTSTRLVRCSRRLVSAKGRSFDPVRCFFASLSLGSSREDGVGASAAAHRTTVQPRGPRRWAEAAPGASAQSHKERAILNAHPALAVWQGSAPADKGRAWTAGPRMRRGSAVSTGATRWRPEQPGTASPAKGPVADRMPQKAREAVTPILNDRAN